MEDSNYCPPSCFISDASLHNCMVCVVRKATPGEGQSSTPLQEPVGGTPRVLPTNSAATFSRSSSLLANQNRGQSIQPSCFSPASARPSNESRGKGAPGGFGPRDLGPKTGHFELSLSPQPEVCGFDCDDAELCKRLTKNIIRGSSLCDICSNEDLILLKEIVMAGPATVRMVRVNPSLPAPLPLPLHVPPGHIVQQIVDEHGVLRHLILSPQQPPQYPHLPPFPPGMPPPQHQPNYNCKARRFHQRMSSQTGIYANTVYSIWYGHLCQLITTCAMVATAP